MITEVSLFQFKNFAEQTKVKLSNLNIVYGCNGRGKSTLFQSILLLAQTMRADDKLLRLRLNGEFVKIDRFEDALNAYADESLFSIGIVSEGDVIEAVYEQGEKPQLANLRSLKINGADYLIEKGTADGIAGVCPQERSFLTTSDIKGLSDLRNVHFVSADRRGPCNSVRRNDSLDNNSVGIHGENVISMLYLHPEILRQVNEAMDFIFKGATVRCPSEAQEDELRLLMDSENGKDGFKPYNVGFGYSHLLPIVVQVLLAREGGLIFIENPEAHLHPGAQSRLVDFLVRKMKEKSLQLFVETHSDHTINGARLAVKKDELEPDEVNVVFLAKDPLDDRALPKVEPIRFSSNGALSDYPDDFMDEWSIQAGLLL